MTKKWLILVLFIVLFQMTGFAQDMHYSQFDESPLFLNPALCGNFNGDYRLVFNHKNQWQAITTPYKTYSVAFDTHFALPKIWSSNLGLGLLVNNDKAGDLNFGFTGVNLVASLQKYFFSDSALSVSVGVLTGFDQYGLDLTAISLDNQFNGTQYDPNVAPNQALPSNHFSILDLGSGMFVQYKFTDNISSGIGGQISHINQPKLSLFGTDNEVLPRKIMLHAFTEFKTSINLSFIPSALFARQQNSNEIAAGGLIKFFTENRNIPAFYIGGWYRFKDANILKAALDYKNLHVGLSYDINTSSLVNASKGQGGYEIAVTYIIPVRQLLLPDAKRCPVFF